MPKIGLTINSPFKDRNVRYCYTGSIFVKNVENILRGSLLENNLRSIRIYHPPIEETHPNQVWDSFKLKICCFPFANNQAPSHVSFISKLGKLIRGLWRENDVETFTNHLDEVLPHFGAGIGGQHASGTLLLHECRHGGILKNWWNSCFGTSQTEFLKETKKRVNEGNNLNPQPFGLRKEFLQFSPKKTPKNFGVVEPTSTKIPKGHPIIHRPVLRAGPNDISGIDFSSRLG